MIIRGPRKERDFTVLSNAVLRDERLSFKARGMLVYGLSQPVAYRMTREDLAAASPEEGEKSIRNGLAELQAAGYLVRRRLRSDSGAFAWESVLYEEPQDDTTEATHTDSTTGGSGPLVLTSGNGAKPQVAASGPSSPVIKGPSSTEVLVLEGLKNGALQPGPQPLALVSDSVSPPATDLGFEAFWESYPKRNGKKLGKAEAEAVWKRLSRGQRQAAAMGAQHYAEAVDAGLFLAKDAHRWLKGSCWQEWQERAQPGPRRVNGRPYGAPDAVLIDGVWIR